MIDADLQDPPELIPTMIEQWSQGADVVYAVRSEREGETRVQARHRSWFYKLFDKLAQVDLSRTPATSGCSTAARWTRCWR